MSNDSRNKSLPQQAPAASAATSRSKARSASAAATPQPLLIRLANHASRLEAIGTPEALQAARTTELTLASLVAQIEADRCVLAFYDAHLRSTRVASSKNPNMRTALFGMGNGDGEGAALGARDLFKGLGNKLRNIFTRNPDAGSEFAPEFAGGPRPYSRPIDDEIPSMIKGPRPSSGPSTPLAEPEDGLGGPMGGDIEDEEDTEPGAPINWRGLRNKALIGGGLAGAGLAGAGLWDRYNHGGGAGNLSSLPLSSPSASPLSGGAQGAGIAANPNSPIGSSGGGGGIAGTGGNGIISESTPGGSGSSSAGVGTFGPSSEQDRINVGLGYGYSLLRETLGEDPANPDAKGRFGSFDQVAAQLAHDMTVRQPNDLLHALGGKPLSAAEQQIVMDKFKSWFGHQKAIQSGFSAAGQNMSASLPSAAAGSGVGARPLNSFSPTNLDASGGAAGAPGVLSSPIG